MKCREMECSRAREGRRGEVREDRSGGVGRRGAGERGVHDGWVGEDLEVPAKGGSTLLNPNP
jgi:hypothetical protein